MNNDKSVYFCSASWETRFLESAKRIIPQTRPSRILCYWFRDYAERTQENRNEFMKLFKDYDIEMIPLDLYISDSFSSSHEGALWRCIHEAIEDFVTSEGSFHFDITTIPREALWITLDLLKEKNIPGIIYYSQANSHGAWCSSNPNIPHIVPKLGGVAEFDRPTKLIILSGYDVERCDSLIMHYEPEATAIFLQEGYNEDFEKNQEPHKKRFSREQNVELLKMNSYSSDWGYSTISKFAKSFGENANLLLASVGPKTSSVALYLLQQEMPNTMLVYSSARDYNMHYSEEIRDVLTFKWPHR